MSDELDRHKVKKDFSKWSRKLLICLGLESIGKHLVGQEKWESLYPDWRNGSTPPNHDLSEERTSTVTPEQEILEKEGETVIQQEAETNEEETHENGPSQNEEDEPTEKNEFLDNFVHMLPYWFFMNRAFGLGHAEGGTTDSDFTNDLIDSINQRSQLLNAHQLNYDASYDNGFIQQVQAQPAAAQLLLESPLLRNLSPMLSMALVERARNNEGVRTDDLSMAYQEYCREALRLSFWDLPSVSDQEMELAEPLDLTQKNCDNEGYMVKDYDDCNGQTKRKSPPTPDFQYSKEGKSPKMLLVENNNSKLTGGVKANQRGNRGYTNEELEAALHDIQSGKLGTRRAAVIYGIPRSTLRNKVYKLGKDKLSAQGIRSPTFSAKCKKGPTATACASSAEDMERRSPSEDNVQVPSTITRSLFNGRENGVSPFSGENSTPPLSTLTSCENELEKMAAAMIAGATHDSDLSDDMSEEKRKLKEWLRSRMLRKRSGESDNGPEEGFSLQRFSTKLGGDESSSVLDICRVPMERHSDTSDNSSSEEVSMEHQDLLAKGNNVILKIPSVLNNKSSLNKVISTKNKLKRRPTDVNRKFSPLFRWDAGVTQNCLNENKNELMDTDTTASTSPMTANMTSNLYSKDNLRDSKDTGSESKGDGNMSNDAAGKKSRPKRGKYRNYDRDALVKAVRAVQNGEMSVHRAGSFFGVPHSTLEYKVKERHLLRRPKRKGASSPAKLIQKSSPESSMSGSDPQQMLSDLGESGTTMTPDLRDSISRYLNLGMYGQLPPSLLIEALPSKSSEESRASENSSSSRGPNSLASMFNLEELVRRNLQTDSLLDLTKKS